MVPKGTQKMLSLPEEPDEELNEAPALEQRADEPGGDERDAAEDLQRAARFPPAGEAAVEIFPTSPCLTILVVMSGTLLGSCSVPHGSHLHVRRRSRCLLPSSPCLRIKRLRKKKRRKKKWK